MPVIEETRKLIQDFLAPELRKMKATLNAIQGRLDPIDARFDQLDRRLTSDRADILRHMDHRFDDMMDMVRVRERLAVVEANKRNWRAFSSLDRPGSFLSPYR